MTIIFHLTFIVKFVGCNHGYPPALSDAAVSTDSSSRVQAPKYKHHTFATDESSRRSVTSAPVQSLPQPEMEEALSCCYRTDVMNQCVSPSFGQQLGNTLFLSRRLKGAIFAQKKPNWLFYL